MNADKNIKNRIIESSKVFINNASPKNNDFLEQNQYSEFDLAFYKAIRLLFQIDSDFLQTISLEIWQKWIPIILAYPNQSDIIHYSLLGLAYNKAPNEFIDTLIKLIDKEDKAHSYIFIIRDVEDFIDDRLTEALLNKLYKNDLKLKSFNNLLEILIQTKNRDVIDYAKNLMTRPFESNNLVDRYKGLITAINLLVFGNNECFKFLWNRIKESNYFGRVLIALAFKYYDHKIHNVLEYLTGSQLAELYIWLENNFPKDKDPQFDEVHKVGPREEIGQYRDNILNHLENIGTFEACDAINSIIKAFPEREWLNYYLINAKKETFKKTWNPPQISDLIKLLNNSEKRLVQNSEQLVNIILESLSNLQNKLKGATPDAPLLWDTHSQRPKDENALSDFIKNRLKENINDKGIIINREVEIYKNPITSGMGNRTDIHIQAISKSGHKELYKNITVIIEVKGSWHRELKAAMKTQLLDDYLNQDIDFTHGIYLVAWFDFDKWNKEYRKGNAQRNFRTFDEAKEFLTKQAEELSTNAKIINIFLGSSGKFVGS